MSLEVKPHTQVVTLSQRNSPKPNKTPPQLLKLQVCTHLGNVTPQQDLFQVQLSTLHSENSALPHAWWYNSHIYCILMDNVL